MTSGELNELWKNVKVVSTDVLTQQFAPGEIYQVTEMASFL
jgi:hypothetical protein